MKQPRGQTTPAGLLLGQRLRELREKRGLIQLALAEFAGISHIYVSAMERGVTLPNLLTVLRLAVALNCKPSALITEFDSADVASLLPE